MANPSTTGPSGAGTEVLRRVQFNGVNNAEQIIFTVPQNHIYTVLSITICNMKTLIIKNILNNGRGVLPYPLPRYTAIINNSIIKIIIDISNKTGLS